MRNLHFEFAEHDHVVRVENGHAQKPICPFLEGQFYVEIQTFCYIDANYVAVSGIEGIAADTVMGHHGVGIFWNVEEWTLAK